MARARIAGIFLLVATDRFSANGVIYRVFETYGEIREHQVFEEIVGDCAMMAASRKNATRMPQKTLPDGGQT